MRGKINIVSRSLKKGQGMKSKHKSSDKMLAAADPSVPRDKAIRIGLDAGKHVKGDARSRVRSCPTTSSFSVKC